MNDTELSEAEQDRMRTLLRRAADGLHVTTPPVPTYRSRPSRRRTGWLAAASLLVIAALGATWWATRPERQYQYLDAGPLEIRIDPTVVEQTGMWRLPTEDSGVDALEVYESQTNLGFQLAVDDVESPERWLAIVPSGFPVTEHPDAEPPVTIGDATSAILLHSDDPDDPTWLELTEPGSSGELTMAYQGLGDEQVLAAATELVGRIGSLTDVDAVNRALASFVPPDGLVPTWDPERGAVELDPSSAPTSLVGLMTRSAVAGDTDVSINLRATGLPPAVAQVELLLQAEAAQLLAQTGGPPSPGVLVDRPDLGEGVWALSYPESPHDTLMVITEDGVSISAVATVAAVEAGPEDGTDSLEVAPLTVEQQIHFINSLRAMTEEEFLLELDRRGVDHYGIGDEIPLTSRLHGGTGEPDEPGSTTTMQAGPGG